MLSQSILEQRDGPRPRYKTTDKTPEEKVSAIRYPSNNAELGHVNWTWLNDMHHGSSHDLIPQRIRATASGRACRRKWSLFEVAPLVATGGCTWDIPKKKPYRVGPLRRLRV